MNGISSASAASTSSSDTRGWRIVPRASTGPDPSACAPEDLISAAGRVGRVGDVDDDRACRLQRVGGRARPGEADLLLHGGDGDRPSRRPRRPRRPRRRAGPPRARRSSRGGCRARATRGADPGSRAARRRSRRRRRSARSSRASSPLAAPMSMCRSRISGTCLRSSSLEQVDRLAARSRRGSEPSRVVRRTRWPTRICGSHPPTLRNHRKPSSSMCVTMQPDLVDVPDDGHARAVLAPRRRSPSTSRACRSPPLPRRPRRRPGKAAAGAVSWPDGPAAVTSARRASVGLTHRRSWRRT